MNDNLDKLMDKARSNFSNKDIEKIFQKDIDVSKEEFKKQYLQVIKLKYFNSSKNATANFFSDFMQRD